MQTMSVTSLSAAIEKTTDHNDPRAIPVQIWSRRRAHLTKPVHS